MSAPISSDPANAAIQQSLNDIYSGSTEVEMVKGGDGRSIQALFDGRAGGLDGEDSKFTSKLAEQVDKKGVDWLIDASSRENDLSESELETLREFAKDIQAGKDTGDNSATDNISLLIDENGLIAKVTDNSDIASQVDSSTAIDKSLEFTKTTSVGSDTYAVTEEFNVKSAATPTVAEPIEPDKVDVVSSNDGWAVAETLAGGAGWDNGRMDYGEALVDRVNEEGLAAVIEKSAAANNLSAEEIKVLNDFAEIIRSAGGDPDQAKKDAMNSGTVGKTAILIDEDGLIAEVTSHSNISGQLDGVSNADLRGWQENSIAGRELELDGNKYKVANNHAISPLVFDLEGDGIETTDTTVRYDLDGDGDKEKVNNVEDAILAFNGGDDGSELFGNNTDLGMGRDYANGFQALRALAEKEGLIGPGDQMLGEEDIKHLEEKYGFGVKTDGYGSQVDSLLDEGVTQINLGQAGETEWDHNFDGQGNALQTQEGATFRMEDGEVNDFADVWHQKR